MMSPSVAIVVALLCTAIHKSNADYIDDFVNVFVKTLEDKNLMVMFDFAEIGDVQALADAFQEAMKKVIPLIEKDPGTLPTDMRDAVVKGTSNYGSAIPKEKWAEMYARATAIALAGKGAVVKANAGDMASEYVDGLNMLYKPDKATVNTNIENIIFAYYSALNAWKVVETEDGLVFGTGRLIGELNAICPKK